MNHAVPPLGAQDVTSAYVHVPFCRHRCGYCNFTVIAQRDDLVPTYLSAIESELARLETSRPVRTLFIGGGTPTHLEADVLADFLARVQNWFPLVPDAEFSVEANPEDLTGDVVEALLDAGVTRVSLGQQSFDAAKLAILERGHDAAAGQRTLARLRPQLVSASLDLIFGVPGETRATWQADLAQAIAIAPDHISTYGLTFETGTSFERRRRRQELIPLAEELERSLYEVAIDTLTAAGYEHYEVSNFARAGHRCAHNENYWLCGGYFGVGPGAASYVDGVRRTNHRSTTTYLQRALSGEDVVAEAEGLDARAQAHECLVFGLRRLEGVPIEGFAERTGFTMDDLVGEHLEWLCDDGLLAREGGRLKLTRHGLLVSDSIWPYLI